MRKSASEVLPRPARQQGSDDESGNEVELASFGNMGANIAASQSEPVLKPGPVLRPLEPTPVAKLLAAARDVTHALPPQPKSSAAASIAHAMSASQLPLQVLTKNKNTKTLAILPTLGYIPFQGKSRRAREREATSAPPQRKREIGAMFARIQGNPLTDDVVAADAFRSQDGSDGVLEGMSLQELMRIKGSFKALDVDGSGSIDLAEFKTAMGTVAGARDVDAERLFMKIDADADGTLTWEEFLVYIVLHQQGTFKMKDEQTMNVFGNARNGKIEGEADAGRHDDAVNRILRLPDAHLFGRNKYIATSKAGLISCWDAHPLRHLQTSHKPGKAWLTDACYLYRKTPEPHHVLDKLAVFGIDRRVDIFTMKDAAFEHEGFIELDSIPLCALFCIPRGEPLVCYGDDKGFITLLDAYKVSRRQADDVQRCRVRVHSDWVTAVQYAPDLGCILSSSLDGTLKVSDPERSLQLMITLSGHRKGIHTFAWSPTHHLVATGGIERYVNVWSLARNKPLYTLHGHSAPIRQVVVDDTDSQVISLDLDDVVKVWDIRTGQVIQTIDGEGGRFPRSASGTGGIHHSVLFFDDLNARLVSAHRTVTVWPALGRLAAMAEVGRVRSHAEPCVGALYNEPFAVVISADANSVSTWDLETGEQSFFFKDTHPGAKISAMCLDRSGRRLITGASDGTVRVWNFTSGQAIREGESPTRSELTSVLYLAEGPFRFIVGVGWNRKVLLWDDADTAHRRMTLAHVFTGITDDILCVAHCPPGHIATCSYDGSVAVWNINSGAIRCRMRSSAPVAPLAPAPSSSSSSGANRHSSISLPPRPSRRTSSSPSGASGPQAGPSGPPAAAPPGSEALAVEKVVCLQRRNGVIATAGVDGTLRFWSAHTGQQLHVVHAGHAPGEPLVALATDRANTLLISGDAVGTVKVWEISGEDPPPHAHHHAGRGAAPAPALRVAPLHHFVAQRGSRLASVELIESQRLIVTASEDCTVMLWTLGGACVGTFGQAPRWSLADEQTWARPSHAPYNEADFVPHGHGAGRPRAAAGVNRKASVGLAVEVDGPSGPAGVAEAGLTPDSAVPPTPSPADGDSAAGDSPARGGGPRGRAERSPARGYVAAAGRAAAGVKGAEIFSQQAASEIPHSLRFHSQYLESQVATLYDKRPSVSHRIDYKPLAPVPDIPAFFQTHKLDKLFLHEPLSKADRERR